jgi:hypothetical protein
MLRRAAGSLGRGKTAALAAGCLALALASDLLAFGLKPRPESPPTFYRGDVKTLVEWGRENTGEGEAFLANLGASAALLAYADRPTVINPKFETARLRNKFERFALTLFGSEEELHALCLEYGAAYFVHENHFVLDRSRKSFRYLADRLRLPAAAAAYRMQFEPEGLKLFAPAHQTSTFRVYRVLRPGGKKAPRGVFPYDPMYDPRVFGAEPGDKFFDDAPVMRAAVRILLEKEGAKNRRRPVGSGARLFPAASVARKHLTEAHALPGLAGQVIAARHQPGLGHVEDAPVPEKIAPPGERQPGARQRRYLPGHQQVQ